MGKRGGSLREPAEQAIVEGLSRGFQPRQYAKPHIGWTIRPSIRLLEALKTGRTHFEIMSRVKLFISHASEDNRVVSDLKRSIEAGERTKDVNDPLASRIKAFQETADAEERYQAWAWSGTAVEAVWREWNSIAPLAREALDRHNEKRFQVVGPQRLVADRSHIEVQGPSFLLSESRNRQSRRRLVLRFGIWGMSINWVLNARARYRVLLEHVGQTTALPDFTAELQFRPYCNKYGGPSWQDQSGGTFTTEDLVKLAIIELFDTANKLQNGEPLTYRPEID